MSSRSSALAARIEQGANALAAFASTLTDAEWRKPVPGDGRSVGAVAHHVASVYPLEVQLAQTLAAGNAISGVTFDAVHEMNAKHAKEHGGTGRDATVALIRSNSRVAAEAVRKLTDADLDRAASVSLYFDAPLTCQFFIEDHALRHSFHHLGRIRAALGK